MSDTLLVSTRKGLFTVVAQGGAVGDHGGRFPRRQRHAHADRPARRADLCGARSRPFRRQAAPLDRRTAGRRSPPPSIRPSPRATRRTTCGAGRCNWSTARIWALAAGGADEPGVLWCGTLPGGLFRSTDHGAELGDGALAVGPSQAQAVDGRRRRPAGHPFDLRRSARFEARVGRGLDRRRLVHARTAARPGRCAARACAPSMLPPEQTHDPDRPGRPLPGAMPGGAATACGCSTTTASSSRPTRAGRSRRSTDVEPSTFGFAVAVHPREPDTAWFVPEIKDEKRIPREGKLVVTRTRDGGKSFDVLTQGPAAVARLRPRLPPRARDRRDRRPARLRLDHRRPVGERGPGRQLGLRDATRCRRSMRCGSRDGGRARVCCASGRHRDPSMLATNIFARVRELPRRINADP